MNECDLRPLYTDDTFPINITETFKFLSPVILMNEFPLTLTENYTCKVGNLLTIAQAIKETWVSKHFHFIHRFL